MSFTGPQSRLATPLLLQYNHILIRSLLYTKAQEPIAKNLLKNLGPVVQKLISITLG